MTIFPVSDILNICTANIKGAQNRNGCADYGKSDVPQGMAAYAAWDYREVSF